MKVYFGSRTRRAGNESNAAHSVRPHPSHRVRVIAVTLAVIGLAGYSVQPASVNRAEARPISSTVAYLHDISAAQFAAEATHIGALRGMNARSLLRRFTASSHLHAAAETGQRLDGGLVNVNNWTLTPAGDQSTLGDFPVANVKSPDGQRMLVVNSGAGIQSLQVIRMSDRSVIQSIPYKSPKSVFVGAAFSPNGRQVYVSGGGENVVHTFDVGDDGTLSATGDLSDSPAVAPFKQLSTSSYPTGLSVSRDGKTLYVANSNGNTVAVFDTATRKMTASVTVGLDPYGALVDKRSGLVYVSNWGDASVSVIDPRNNAVVATIQVGQHPSSMTAGPGGTVYVSDSNSDAVSIIDTQAKTEVSRVPVLSDPNLPLSSSPQGLAVSPDGKRLYVADAGDNALSVFNLSTDGRTAYFQGWIPTAWYPTDVVVGPDSKTLFVTNGFGMGEHANNGALNPNPTRPTPSDPLIQGPGYCNCALDQFSGTMDPGTLSAITTPDGGELTNDTLRVARNDHFFDLSPTDRSAGNPIPLPGQTSPIKHVIYILKENRTYDQVFGDLTTGKGDPSLALFPRSVTPNLHALADRFGVLDNFYADAQVSADGHNWSLSANANDYTEKTWPQDYSTPVRNFGYPFESGSAMALSPGGYLWDAAANAGISYRNYGLYANFDNPAAAVIQPADQSCAGPTAHVYIGMPIPAGDVLCFQPTSLNAAVTPNLVGHIDPRYINYDMRYPDLERVAEWKREFDNFVTNGNLPNLEFMRLSNDHTRGTASGAWTPQRYVSENDAAVGQVVDAVSHSPYWSSTTIFVVEDDAQNGPDHLDSHRTEALVISPYTSRATPRAESTHYDTAAMVRTIELILGLKPLSQYDATATPMWQAFANQPDTTPYTAIPQSVTTGTSTLRMFGSVRSSRLNFVLPDQAQAAVLNRILWHAIKGARTPYPGAMPYGIPSLPTRSTYVWGAMATKAYPLLSAHDSGVPHVVTELLRNKSRVH